MATSVTLNGTSYSIPALNEDNWGDEVSNYLIALSTGVLPKSGGAFTLTAEVDFGVTYGLKAVYFKSRGTVASTGILRLANTETLSWRNAANNMDLDLTASASDRLTFGGVNVPTISSTDTLTNKSIDSDNNTITNIVNTDIKSGAAIDATKIHDGSVSNTEFGYLANVTSDIQSQINAIGSGGQVSTDLSVGNVTVNAGTTLMHPFLNIDSGDIYTINGQMVVSGDLIVTGTLIVSGTVLNN